MKHKLVTQRTRERHKQSTLKQPPEVFYSEIFISILLSHIIYRITCCICVCIDCSVLISSVSLVRLDFDWFTFTFLSVNTSYRRVVCFLCSITYIYLCWFLNAFIAKLFYIPLVFRFSYSIYSMATTDTVYNTTTTAQESKSRKWLIVPSENLDKVRFVIKVMEVVSNMFHVLSENTVFPRWTQMRPHVYM